MSGVLTISFERDDDFEGSDVVISCRIEDEFIGEFYEPFTALLRAVGFGQTTVDEFLPDTADTELESLAARLRSLDSE